MAVERVIEISTEFIKLSDLLKFASIVPGGSDAKHLILDGAVFVDGETCLQRGRKIYPGMKVNGVYDNEKFCLTVNR